MMDTAIQRRTRLRSTAAGVLVGALVVITGLAIGAGGKLLLVGIAAALLPFILLLIDNAVRGQGRVGILSVEAPLILLLLSDVTFRVRTTEQLSNNPLDAAGVLRAVAQALALFLALVALMGPRVRERDGRLTTRPFRIYCVYVVVAAAGITMSHFPVLTAYRVFEVVVAIAVIGAAVHAYGSAVLPRIERTLYWWLALLVITCWLNVVIAPHSAVIHARHSPLPWQLQPVFPVMPANTVGFLAVCLALWSGGRLLTPRRSDFPGPKVLQALAGLGVITLVAAQYRTGYVALAAGTVVALALRGRKLLVAAVVIAGILFALWGPRVTTAAEGFALRGAKTTQLGQLNGRVDWWSLALPVWHTSPIIGRGLLTATRLALQSGGFGDTNTIHSTWVETVVGTGVLGSGLLALALLVALRRGLRLARRVDVVPLLLLVAIAVRSVTGNTIESYRFTTLFFVWAILCLKDWVPARAGPDRNANATMQRDVSDTLQRT